MSKKRRNRSGSQTKKNLNRPSRTEKWSNPGSALVTALEQARWDTRQAKRSHPADPSSAAYSPLLNQIVLPAGITMPPIEKLQQGEPIIIALEDLEELEDVGKTAPVRVAPVAFICTLYISLILSSLLHSWSVLGVGLLIGLTLTGIVALLPKRGISYVLMEFFLWVLFAVMCGYIGWLVCDSYLPLIIRCLCAFIGFILGAFTHYLLTGIINARDSKQMRGIKYCAVTALVDSLCFSIVFGFLLQSWSMLGISLLVGLILIGIIVLSAMDKNQTGIDIVWLLFALMWGYAGWFVFDAHIPSIVHFLCAMVGLVLGFVGYPLAYSFLSPMEEEEEDRERVGEVKR